MRKLLPAYIALSLAATPVAYAQDAAEMARKLQDPLANIKALTIDSGFEFKSGEPEKTSYSFQLQPVYAMPFEKFNFITRGVVPILGIAGGGQKPILGEPLPKDDSLTWGLSDIALQFFFSPKSDASWKWGIGPMVSLATRTKSDLAGPGWGGGPIGVLVGNLSEDVSLAIIGGQLWGEENGFSTSFVQPILNYNLPGFKAVALSYNNSIAYDWNASSGNAWTVPLGAGISKTFVLDGGYGMDLGIGYYFNVEKPEGAADSVMKLSVTLVLP